MLASVLRSALRLIRSRRRGAAPGPVVFVADVPEPLQVAVNSGLYSAQASIRLRTIIPARALAAAAPVWLLPPHFVLDGKALKALGTPQALVVAKFTVSSVTSNRSTFERLLAWLGAMRGRFRLVADFSDNYAALEAFEGVPFLRRYQEHLARSCHVVASCEALRAELAPIAARGISVIEDPYESPVARPCRAPQDDPLRLCWFGNIGQPTLATLERALRGIAARFSGRPIEIELVSAASRREMLEKLGARLRAASTGLRTRFTEWSLDETWNAIARCDLVVLPQDAGSPWGRVKSHNRLVESLRGGRLAVASAIPSYLELGEFAWVGERLEDGIAWALGNPQAAARRVALGQDYVERRFAPEAIGARWTRALGLAADALAGSAA